MPTKVAIGCVWAVGLILMLAVLGSIIVRKSDQQIAMETLKDQFFRWTSIEPRLKVN